MLDIMRVMSGSEKILKNRHGSISDKDPHSSNSYFTSSENFKIFVSSWNVGGVPPPEDLDMEELLNLENNPADIYVLGFQEIVPLKARNVLGPKNGKVALKWNTLIGAALNKKMPPINTGDIGEFQKVHPVRIGSSGECNSSQNFQCIMSKQMVGIYLSVWCRSDLYPYIQHPSFSCVGCGIMGCLGNKGSVSIRFCLHETSLCFVCCHLASGGEEGDERKRNADVAEILSRTCFPRGLSRKLPRKILDHDRVIWLGDLNYRINLPDCLTRTLVEKKEWNTLLERDQLKAEFTEGHVFDDWHEGEIEFAPTYKYYPNSQVYYGCYGKEIGDKKRAPAWCDRILWYGKGLKPNQYDRGEIHLSDHRPVQATFIAQIEISENLNEYQLPFVERFDDLTSHFGESSIDEITCNGT